MFGFIKRFLGDNNEKEIKRVDGFPTSFEYSCKSNKKDYRKAIKGVKLTAKYIKKMEKFGYSVENARFEKENDK